MTLIYVLDKVGYLGSGCGLGMQSSFGFITPLLCEV